MKLFVATITLLLALCCAYKSDEHKKHDGHNEHKKDDHKKAGHKKQEHYDVHKVGFVNINLA